MEYLHESPGVGKSLVKMCVCAKLKLLTGEYRYYHLAGCILVFFRDCKHVVTLQARF